MGPTDEASDFIRTIGGGAAVAPRC